VAVASGFTGTITFTCTDPAPQSICTPPQPGTPATIAAAGGKVSFSVSTTAPTASLTHPVRPFDRGSRIFYAMLLPGLLGILFTFGPRKPGSRRRGMRMLGLIVALGFSTLWLGSCGGSSSNGGGGNGGTTPGSYTITVGATSGTATTPAATFQLVVSQ
jgi:hypothetical protein